MCVFKDTYRMKQCLHVPIFNINIQSLDDVSEILIFLQSLVNYALEQYDQLDDSENSSNLQASRMYVCGKCLCRIIWKQMPSFSD